MRFDHKTFFKGYRSEFDHMLEQSQVDAIEFLLTSFENDGTWDDMRRIAYAMATVFHETAGSMQPVEEGYYLGSKTRVKAFQKGLRYYPYYGRGYVQLTWNTRRIPNYRKASDALGIDFVSSPDLVMEPTNAFRIMTLGMHEGWFTGKKLADYIHGGYWNYVNARQIINGLDKAALIAGYARKFEQILKASAVDSTGADAREPLAGESATPQLPTGGPTTQNEPPPSSTAQAVVVEKETNVGFFTGIKLKIAGWFGTIGGMAALRQYQDDISGLGIPGAVTKYAVLAVLGAFVLWFLYQGARHLISIISKRMLTTSLVHANATPTNTVIVACPEDLATYEAAGYKVIRRQ